MYTYSYVASSRVLHSSILRAAWSISKTITNYSYPVLSLLNVFVGDFVLNHRIVNQVSRVSRLEFKNVRGQLRLKMRPIERNAIKLNKPIHSYKSWRKELSRWHFLRSFCVIRERQTNFRPLLLYVKLLNWLLSYQFQALNISIVEQRMNNLGAQRTTTTELMSCHCKILESPECFMRCSRSILLVHVHMACQTHMWH